VTLKRIKKWLHFTVVRIFMFIKPTSSIIFHLNVNKAEVNRITNVNMIHILHVACKPTSKTMAHVCW
jgi:hypothetical protein